MLTSFLLTNLLPDQICNSSPQCQQYNTYNVSSDNLLLDQLIIPKLIFILMTYLLDIVLVTHGSLRVNHFTYKKYSPPFAISPLITNLGHEKKREKIILTAKQILHVSTLGNF